MFKIVSFIFLALFSQASVAAHFPASFYLASHPHPFSAHDTFIARDMTNQLLKTRLLQQYADWKGTRYHMGGSSHRGVDCSALMQHLFAESMALSLPRTTSEQMRRGKAVSREELKPGDLVFFQTGRRQRHVGVFIGGDEFIHASTSEGVTISSLNNEYWRTHYQAARRVAVKPVG